MTGMGHLWAILLAAGEGSRVRSLITDRGGHPVPKQYWALDGRESLLRNALARAEQFIPKTRILAVVAPDHQEWWEHDLEDLPPYNVLVQPCNRGTACGLLLPLLQIQRRDPSARVLVLPSDHYVEDETRLGNAMVFADRAATQRGDQVVLLGMTPSQGGGEYGWIVPAGPEKADHTAGVGSFVEKPPPLVAKQLAERGGVWNSLIFVSTLRALIEAYSRAVPNLLATFADWNRDSPRGVEGLSDLYGRLPSVDFSRGVLEASESILRVVTVSGSGWVDIGTPETLRAFLPGSESAQGQTASPLSA